MKNLFLIKFLFLFLFLNYQVVYASWLDDAWNNITTQSGSSIQNQGAVGFSGGSFTMATPNVKQSLFNVTTPTISAGCSGISIDMGAFQYNKEAIVNFITGLLQQAPGYAFNLAMQVLCPSCTDLLNTMNQMAGIINGMQLDSCATLNFAGNMLNEKLANSSVGSKLGDGKGNMFNNAVSVMNSAAKEISNSLNDIVKCLNNPGGNCPIEFFKGEQSFFDTLWENLTENQIFTDSIKEVFGEDIFKEILNALLGDIKIVKSEGDGDNFKVEYIPSVYESDKDVEKLNNLLSHGNSKNIEINKNTKPKDSAVISVLNDTEVQINPVSAKTNEIVSEIYDKFSKRDTLDEVHLNFLMMFQSPVYKFLNQYSIDNNLLKRFTDDFKIVAGYQLMYEYISIISSNLFRTINKLKSQINKVGLMDNVLEESIKKMEDKLYILQGAAYKNYLTSYNLFSKETRRGMEDMKIINNFKNAYMARHPVVSNDAYAKKLY